MSRIVQFDTKKGPVFVEVDEYSAPVGDVLAATGPGIIAKAQKTFGEALQAVKPGVEEALSLVTGLVKKPSEAEIEFGIKVDAAAGAVFAKAGTEATFHIKLTWK